MFIKCRRTRHETMRVLGFRPKGHRVSLGDHDLNKGAVFQPAVDTPFFLHLSTIFRWVQKLKT